MWLPLATHIHTDFSLSLSHVDLLARYEVARSSRGDMKRAIARIIYMVFNAVDISHLQKMASGKIDKYLDYIFRSLWDVIVSSEKERERVRFSFHARVHALRASRRLMWPRNFWIDFPTS